MADRKRPIVAPVKKGKSAPIEPQKRKKATDQNVEDSRAAGRIIAAIFDVHEDDLWKPRKARNAGVRFARQTLHYVLHTELQLSVHVIADIFDRDRKTISPSIPAFEEAREHTLQDEALKELGRLVRQAVDYAKAWRVAITEGVAEATRLAAEAGEEPEDDDDD